MIQRFLPRLPAPFRSVLFRPLFLWSMVPAVIVLVPLPASANHDLPHTLENAWARSPDLAVVKEAAAETEARRDFGERLLPTNPGADILVRNDRLGRNEGDQEYELGFSTEVWLPGQAAAHTGLANELRRHLTAQADVTRLDIAGRVRRGYWAYRTAEKSVQLATRRLQAARDLADNLRRQEKAGEVALSDVLIADAETLAAENFLRAQETVVQAARLDFEALTGGPPTETFQDIILASKSTPAGSEIDSHPRLVELSRRLEVARANLTLAQTNDRSRPEVGVFGLVERDAFDEPVDASVGFRLSVPLGRDPESRIGEARENTEISRVAAARKAMRIRLQTDLRRARADQAAAARQARLDQQRLDILVRQAALIERSQQSGNASLADVIAARSLVFEAELAKAKSDTDVLRTKSEVAQALGRLPVVGGEQ